MNQKTRRQLQKMVAQLNEIREAIETIADEEQDQVRLPPRKKIRKKFPRSGFSDEEQDQVRLPPRRLSVHRKCKKWWHEFSHS